MLADCFDTETTLEDRGHHWGLDEMRRDRVHAHVFGSIFDGGDLSDVLESFLGPCVRGAAL
jgi:hypothetical protein